MARVDTVLNSIRRGIETGSMVPDETDYRVRRVDSEGADTGMTLPNVVIDEVTTTRDDNRSTDLVGVVRDEQTGQVVGRIFEIGFLMDVQIEANVVEGSSHPIGEFAHQVRRALQRYDSQLRDDLFPDGEGGTIGEIQNFTISQSSPQDDLSKTHTLRTERFSAEVRFSDRLNEVDEYGPLEPIKEVRTPRDGDYAGGLSDDYYMEYHAPDDTS